MTPESLLPLLLGIAWLLPLASFAMLWIGFSLPFLAGKRPGYGVQKGAAYIAIGAIGSSFVLSLISLIIWLAYHPIAADAHGHAGSIAYSGDFYSWISIGDLHLTIGYYIDALTVAMFTVVTLISTCVHVYSMGYMHEELHDVTDHEVATHGGEFLHRAGRYHRFYQYLSLFSFSMLGLLIAGSLGMVFMFWELVGICSYFLIGFYFERRSASNAANKAFIVNRVGDFGMLIGLMALWSSLGTLQFGDTPAEQGMFSKLRPAAHHHELAPAAMVGESATHESPAHEMANESAHADSEESSEGQPGYLLLFVGGVGIFCGCVGKSAQFPLHTWLPDAMEGPTPVSALVHSATMVAAGVYLVGRCYPIFVPEALLVIATVGAITLFLAATVAITAYDIKRVLAFSTISQLGYMMLALGLGGWLAGLFHLVTHAFFKSLLFLCSGSVIHAVHTNDMRQMGGLRHKMPWTAYTMLVGCLAIIGAGFPMWGWGLSGYFSKDSIIEQAWSFSIASPSPTYSLLLWLPLISAAITACYMFRLWYMTFTGEPANIEKYEHAHESPRSMVAPLVLLATLAVVAGWSIPFTGGLSLPAVLEQARPAGTLETTSGHWLTGLTIPDEHMSHAPEIKEPAGWAAFGCALGGLLLATMTYVWRWLRAEEVQDSFAPIHRLLSNGWWFDQIYDWMFVKTALLKSKFFAGIDRYVIDPLANGIARTLTVLAKLLDRVVDRGAVDGSLNGLASQTWNLGNSLHRLQTGRLRQYVLFLVLGTLGLFVAASLCWKYALAG
ncbi:NADH-quinone oxidoreductase subunit L [Aeoliella mucimassa]|uniref:NADH-quinone oxidoreductase subunit L n=1 Tax=Aeoliella mucimassa TaxID=2527972 RepID=A0A518ARX4_9BACT|nr:NADH-quinone oxidoreductase subunit L [Aeoliella mucimassa]QDU57475.1 NADH-quinone oxidoreductase subunit L [Aeoliella mucimassa]